jgi:diaminohydroxyphosphoribosylaminopyrimidine deaminase/5-amino-6-(5-phosphoribosylamino)uracil reductase
MTPPSDNQAMSTNKSDIHWMSLALAWAEKSLFTSAPNPRVGCVIVNSQGVLIGAGHTQPVGREHAEVIALQNVLMQGHSPAGATAYVTLEPCSHQGHTGPCCDALIEAEVARVVVAVQDPNPLVNGAGIARIRKAGIQVEVGVLENEAQLLNPGFFKRMRHGVPWIRLKVAASLDGKTALNNGASQWITSVAARQDGHAMRARACAVLTGIGTILEDDPQLNVRDIDVPRQPTLVIIDSKLETPLGAKLWQSTRKVLIYCAVQDANRQSALEEKGASVICLPNSLGKVDLIAMHQDLGKRSFNEVHVEAGHKLNGSLLASGLVDELLVYFAPLLIGQGQGIANMGPLEKISQALKLDIQNIKTIGTDIRLIALIKNESLEGPSATT